jgi:hypothetical protein
MVTERQTFILLYDIIKDGGEISRKSVSWFKDSVGRTRHTHRCHGDL